MWSVYTMEYHSATKRNEPGSSVELWMDLESVVQSEVSQTDKNKYHILMCICGIQKNGTDEPVTRTGIERQMWRRGVWAQREKGSMR